MTRLLITGAAGFVGRQVIRRVAARAGPGIALLAVSRNPLDIAGVDGWEAADIRDQAALERIMRAWQPTHILHLAGITTISEAQAKREEAWSVNVTGSLACLEATIAAAPGASFIFVGTGQAYGASGLDGHALREYDPFQPMSEYARSKAAADEAVGERADRGVRVVRLRPFNHSGPGQPPLFFVPTLIDQITETEAGRAAPVLKVGNLNVERDFLDVRDVADCYLTVVEQSSRLPSGIALNIASGQAYRLFDMIATLQAASTISFELEVEPSRVRSHEIPVFRGDPSFAHRLLGWRPQISVETMLLDTLQAARQAKGLA